MGIDTNRKWKVRLRPESYVYIHHFIYKHVMPLASVPQKGMLDNEGSKTNPGDLNVYKKEW